ncbi:glycosyltransferase family 4 protein [Virgibacillus flavescens]|uniref:glycosyltransferase family 4 protein n=1 Tax=Virgibacillus flavescens TaxID=1611422 RepID=UPI003D33E390
MKVLLVTPNFHQPRGNTITVLRIAEGLEKLGIQSEIVSSTDDTPITTFPKADIVHGFHAYHFYTFKEKWNISVDNYVITLTGTDLNHDLFNEDKRATVLTCLREAKAIHVFDKKAKMTLLNEVPDLESKIAVIHQGTGDFHQNSFNPAKESNTFLYTLPAGIRKVKNIPGAIEMLRNLHTKYPMIRLWLVGPIIEEEEGNTVKNLVKENSDWIAYLGQVDHADMGAIFQQTDTILNSSHSEGQSSAILEGMGYGLPVLVSGNQGNRNIVEHGITGFVYDNPDQFLDYAEKIMNNITIRKKISDSAKRYISENHSSSYEANKLMEIYREALK